METDLASPSPSPHPDPEDHGGPPGLGGRSPAGPHSPGEAVEQFAALFGVRTEEAG